MSALLLALALLTMSAREPGSDGGPTDGLIPGTVVDSLPCRRDPAATYALYLPTDHEPARPTPVLLIMDPRGRARLALDLFRPAAERLGYVLVSSHDTASDGPRLTNVAALRALIPEIESRFKVAPGRLYLAGFSGTARLGWDVGVLLGDGMGGLIGVGGGYPEGFRPPAPPAFPFFGSAGTADFNYEEMRALDRERAEAGLPHRFADFEGPHSWPPEEVCSRALEWMELKAMQSGKAARRPALIGALLASARARAEALDGNAPAAADAWRALAEDFEGLAEVGPATARAAELAARPDVRAVAARELQLAAEREAHDRRFSAWMQLLAGAPQPPVQARSLRTLGINSLKRRLGAGDQMQAAFARRTLENVFVFCSFYLPRQLLDAERPHHALAALAVADAVKPGHPQVCAGRARSYARTGQKKKGLAALDCLVQSGRVGPEFVDSDPGLLPLKSGDAYQELMTRWRAQAPD